MVRGGPFYGCFLSPQGDAFVETYDLEPEPSFRELTKVDRSRRARIQTIVLAAKFDPMFECLIPQLPQKTPNAVVCQLCGGIGWTSSGKIICDRCCGLGWYDAAVFEDDSE
jgi:hypothetical protein